MAVLQYWVILVGYAHTEMGSASWMLGTGAHGWQAVAAGGTSIG